MSLARLQGVDFPWDLLAPHAERARRHPGGIVDLSVGTPVDPTPALVQAALQASSDSPGYPTTQGTAGLREAVADWFARRRGVPGLSPDAVMATVGSKELVGLLPALLGLGGGDVVVHPRIAYPTYRVGALAAGAQALATDDVDDWAGRPDVRLVWVNSPGNPHGGVLGVEALARVVAAARRIGAVVASDECYAELPWTEPWTAQGVPSLLDPRVCGGDHEGLLVAYSLSKQSNLAGYRSAFVAGDRLLVERLVGLRKHLGLIVPRPVQEATRVALQDDVHVVAQRQAYRARRELLLDALSGHGLRVDSSEAGLYLWASDPEGADGWAVVERLSRLGVLVAPGAFYGEAGAGHVRVALTATDERVRTAADRLLAS